MITFLFTAPLVDTLQTGIVWFTPNFKFDMTNKSRCTSPLKEQCRKKGVRKFNVPPNISSVIIGLISTVSYKGTETTVLTVWPLQNVPRKLNR